MKRELIIAAIGAAVLFLIYELLKPKTFAGTAGLSVLGRQPLTSNIAPNFAWTPNPMTGIVSGTPVTLAPNRPVMNPSPVGQLNNSSKVFSYPVASPPSAVGTAGSELLYDGGYIDSPIASPAALPALLTTSGDDYDYSAQTGGYAFA